MGREVFLVAAGALAFVSFAGIIYTWFFGRKRSGGSGLLASSGLGRPSDVRQRLQEDPTGDEFEKLKKLQRKEAERQEGKLTIEDKYYHAGIFTSREQKEFERLRILMPAVSMPLAAFLGFQFLGLMFGVVGAALGLLIGLQLPNSVLDRKIKARGEDIMFFLPLVVEQIAIGVSSSLDVGPCLQRVVQMADERDSHNVVTELIRHMQYHVKSGVSLEEALVEVGSRAGHTELKHTFLALSQVAKHGGEISRQLQELADAVASQRETQIEAKIKKLELEATGPVAMVFLGFILILMIGFGLQLKGIFG